MIKRADASRISREKATKEQIAENFKRLAVDTDKKVQLKPSLLKIQKTLDGNTFGIIHENKTYYLKYTTKKGSTNPTDFKHLDGLNATFGIEKFNSFEKATNKMTFICEAQNNVHKLRLLLEKDGDTEEEVTSDEKEKNLLDALKPAADATADATAEPAAPVNTTQTGAESTTKIADDILGGMNKPDAETTAAPEGDATAAPEGGATDATADATAAPEGGATDTAVEEPAVEEPAADATATPEAPAEEADPKKEFQEAVGKLGQIINDLQDSDNFDEKDIKNAMNSLITAIGPEGFKLVGDKVVESFYKKMQGSEVSTDNTEEETPTEELPAEEPAEEESTEKLDEGFLNQLKAESKRLLKEQLKQELEKRKRNILIESIKKKII
jgi:hypothetical protein